jgi:hypothetical protein
MRITERYRRRDFGHMERLPSMTPNTTRVPSPSRLDRVISDSDVLECVVPRMRRTAFTCSSVGMAVGFAQSGNNRFGAAVSLEPESINALGSLNCADSRRAGNYRSMCLCWLEVKSAQGLAPSTTTIRAWPGRKPSRLVGASRLRRAAFRIRRGFARQARGTDKLSRINKKMPRKTVPTTFWEARNAWM